MRMTVDQVRASLKRNGRARAIRRPGLMNKTEQRYSAHLDALQLAGEVLRWDFEALTLKVGPDCRLTPDFWVVHPDLSMTLVDVKGTKGEGFYAEGDALVKIRAAAEKFPHFRFVIAWFTVMEGWKEKEI